MISPFCPKCKYKMGSGSVCPVCGTSLNSPPPAYEEKERPKLDNRVYDVHFGYRNTLKPKLKKEKNDSIVFIGIIGIIILILIIALVIIL